jgi:hypothetical protein
MYTTSLVTFDNIYFYTLCAIAIQDKLDYYLTTFISKDRSVFEEKFLAQLTKLANKENLVHYGFICISKTCQRNISY